MDILSADGLRKQILCIRENLDRAELLKTILAGIGVSIFAAWLFYRSPYGLVLSAVIVPLFVILRSNSIRDGRLKQLNRQFCSCMEIVSGSLGAGYSMENAWISARRDLVKLYGEGGLFLDEMDEIINGLRMNQPIEAVLMEFASRYEDEDIRSFAEIFKYAKRSGGNISSIIASSIERIQEKNEILQEIENAIAGRKAEQKVLAVMFPGILLFVTFSSPEYVTALYHNTIGVCVMTVSIIGYAFVMFWSNKIMSIEV